MIKLPCFFFLSNHTRVDVKMPTEDTLIFEFHSPNEEIIVKEYKKDQVANVSILTTNLQKYEREALKVFRHYYLKHITQN
ncbi:MAG: hypothetical protein EOO06_19945 [Chitinophagaceae bacterium]|nr:MAG: hypothetical protein EOO06_19945 [Chitinophagaceae bacterium]